MEVCERHVRKRQKGGMSGLHGGTIGKFDKDSMSGGDQIGIESGGAKEIATAARVVNGAMGRVVGNKRSNS